MKYTQNESFIIKEIAGESVLVPRGKAAIEFGGMVAFNETGILIWESIKEPKTFSEIAKTVAGKYNVTFEEVADDVTAFLARAVKEGFIVETEV